MADIPQSDTVAAADDDQPPTAGETAEQDAAAAGAEAAADATASPEAQDAAAGAETQSSAAVAAEAGDDGLAVAESAPQAPQTATRSARAMTGVVTSNKADKTITVRIERRVKHPVYGKFIRRSTKLAAHDENNDCRQGDVVTIVEVRPISKRKSWALDRIVERASA